MVTVPATTVTSKQLADRLKVTDADEATRLYTLVTTTVADALATAWRDVPVTIVDELVYRVGRAYKDAAKTSAGTGQMTVTDTPGPRTPADPLASSYPIIRRYVVMGL